MNTAGTGANPFPWPVGTTTVTSDANGNIRRMQNGTWRAEFDVDYENRLVAVRWPGYPEIRFVYDAVGRKMKEIVNGGSETRFVQDGQDRVVQERDSGNMKKFLVAVAVSVWGISHKPALRLQC